MREGPKGPFFLVDILDIWPYTIDTETKERTMLKTIGIVVLVYLGWVTGLIQATLLVTAGLLTTIASI